MICGEKVRLIEGESGAFVLRPRRLGGLSGQWTWRRVNAVDTHRQLFFGTQKKVLAAFAAGRWTWKKVQRVNTDIFSIKPNFLQSPLGQQAPESPFLKFCKYFFFGISSPKSKNTYLIKIGQKVCSWGYRLESTESTEYYSVSLVWRVICN